MGTIGSMTGASPTEPEFDELLDAALAEWPEHIEVGQGVIYDEGAGTFGELISTKDKIEDKLILNGRLDLIEINWAIFTVLHKASMAMNSISTKDIRIDMVKFFFERNKDR